MPAPTPPLPTLPTLQTVWWVAADRRVVFEYGEQQQLQLRQQTKRMACSELLNVHVRVVGCGWMVGGVGAGEVLQKFFPRAGY
jgi:hypothetical protein